MLDLMDADDLKSQTRYVFILNGGTIYWKSVKQSIFATSSVEAEYIDAFDASKEAIWVRKFSFGLGVVLTIEEPISIYCDNTGAIAIANESGITKGARHFCAKVHYLHEVIEYGDIKLETVHTDDNLVDPFTKALAFPKHSKHTRNIGMLPASSLMQIALGDRCTRGLALRSLRLWSENRETIVIVELGLELTLGDSSNGSRVSFILSVVLVLGLTHGVNSEGFTMCSVNFCVP
nr:hypothetical protein [Tanacetum cinerariifolium]